MSFKNEDEIYAITGGVDGGWKVLNLFNLTTGEKINIGDMVSFDSFFDYRYPITISSNNKFLATNESWGGFLVLDVGTLSWASKFDSLNIYSLAFSPDEKYLATGLTEPYIKIWDFKNNKVAAQYDYNPFIKISNLFYVGEPDSIYPPIKAIAFSPDGRFVAGGNDDGSVIIWENSLINVNENTTQKGDIILFPNPANETVNIKYKVTSSGIINITMTNLLGNYQQCILNERKVPGEYQFDMNTVDLPSGVYILKFSNGMSVTSARFVVMK